LELAERPHDLHTRVRFRRAPANETVCDGQPFFVSGVLDTARPARRHLEPAVLRNTNQIPAQKQGIYYGEGMGSYAVVGQPAGSKPREYGGPLGNNADQYVTYNGSGGVSVASYWRRLL